MNIKAIFGINFLVNCVRSFHIMMAPHCEFPYASRDWDKKIRNYMKRNNNKIKLIMN